MNVYLGLGSNLGDRRAHLARALTSLNAAGTRVLRVSPVVESPALLLDDAPAEWNAPFLNLVAECRTSDPPELLLDPADEVGTSTAVSDDHSVIAVGAPGEASASTTDRRNNSAPGAGAVYVFR